VKFLRDLIRTFLIFNAAEVSEAWVFDRKECVRMARDVGMGFDIRWEVIINLVYAGNGHLFNLESNSNENLEWLRNLSK